MNQAANLHPSQYPVWFLMSVDVGRPLCAHMVFVGRCAVLEECFIFTPHFFALLALP